MSFLRWDSHHECEVALTNLNNAYGCPYVLENGYRMDQWDIITKSDSTNEWGFFAPKERPGKPVDYLRNSIGEPLTESEERPEDWVIDDIDP